MMFARYINEEFILFLLATRLTPNIVFCYKTNDCDEYSVSKSLDHLCIFTTQISKGG